MRLLGWLAKPLKGLDRPLGGYSGCHLGHPEQVYTTGLPSKGLIRPSKGLIRPFKGIIRPLKGLIRPLKGLIRPFRAL